MSNTTTRQYTRDDVIVYSLMSFVAGCLVVGLATTLWGA